MTDPGYDLTRLALFAKTKKALLKTLLEEHRILTAPARHVFVSQGEFTQEFFVLLQGGVSAYRTSEEGRRERLVTLGPGDWFGELSALSNQPFEADLMADVPCVLLVLPSPMFRLLHEKDENFRKLIEERYRARGLKMQLRMTPLFRRLRDEDLERLRAQVEFVVREEGATIAAKDAPAEAVYLVRSGAVVRYVIKETGERMIEAFYGTNSSFGERCLAEDRGRTWPADYRALTRTDLLVIPRETMLATFRERAEVLATLRSLSSLIVAEEEGANTGVYDSESADAPAPMTDTTAAISMAPQAIEARQQMVRHQNIKGGEALVIDLKRCTRCNMCVESCIAVHADGIPRLSKKGNRISVDLCLTTSCYNCEIPECMMACDHGAIRRDRQGLIRFVYDLCVGCSECMSACPYDVIRMTPPPPEEPEAGASGAASGVWAFLERVPGLNSLLARRTEDDDEEEDAPKKKKKKAAGKAVKCDLCAGLPFEACVYNCPCSAISRVDPANIWDRDEIRVAGSPASEG